MKKLPIEVQGNPRIDVFIPMVFLSREELMELYPLSCNPEDLTNSDWIDLNILNWKNSQVILDN